MRITRKDFYGKLNALVKVTLDGQTYDMCNYPHRYYLYRTEGGVVYKAVKDVDSKCWVEEVVDSKISAELIKVVKSKRKQMEREFQTLKKMIKEHNKKERADR